MEQRELPGTSLTVSRLCLGTMTFGSQADAATAAAMVDVCLDAGLNFIDTANRYNDGQSEQLLGTILRNRRDKVSTAKSRRLSRSH